MKVHEIKVLKNDANSRATLYAMKIYSAYADTVFINKKGLQYNSVGDGLYFVPLHIEQNERLLYVSLLSQLTNTGVELMYNPEVVEKIIEIHKENVGFDFVLILSTFS